MTSLMFGASNMMDYGEKAQLMRDEVRRVKT